MRNTTINSFLNVGFHFINFHISWLVRRKMLPFFYIIMLKLMIILMKESIKLITSNVVFYFQIIEYLLNMKWPSNKDPFTLFAMLNNLSLQWCVVHEHVLPCEIISDFKDMIQLISLFILQLSTTVSQTCKWYVMLFNFV